MSSLRMDGIVPAVPDSSRDALMPFLISHEWLMSGALNILIVELMYSFVDSI